MRNYVENVLAKKGASYSPWQSQYPVFLPLFKKMKNLFIVVFATLMTISPAFGDLSFQAVDTFNSVAGMRGSDGVSITGIILITVVILLAVVAVVIWIKKRKK